MLTSAVAVVKPTFNALAAGIAVIKVVEEEPSARGESKSSRQTAARDKDNQYHIRLSSFVS